MICDFCGAEMEKDDVDYNFKGNYDIYWLCPKCESSCIEEVRFSQSFRELWHSELNGECFEKVVQKRISFTKKKYLSNVQPCKFLL